MGSCLCRDTTTAGKEAGAAVSQSEQEEPFGICPMRAIPIGFNGDYLQFVSGWIIIVGGGVEDTLIPAEDSVSNRLSYLAHWSRLKGPVCERTQNFISPLFTQ